MASNPTGAPGTFVYPAGMLNLEYTLTNGQMFRWRNTANGWWDAVSGSQMIRIRQVDSEDRTHDRFEFYTFPEGPDEPFVRQFFRLDVDLDRLILEGLRQAEESRASA